MKNQNGSRERRQQPRFTLSTPIPAKCIMVSLFIPLLKVVIKDISTIGLQILSPKKLKLNNAFKVVIGNTVTCHCIVVREAKTKEGYHYGLEFEKPMSRFRVESIIKLAEKHQNGK